MKVLQLIKKLRDEPRLAGIAAAVTAAVALFILILPHGDIAEMPSIPQHESAEEYEAQLEAKLANLVSSIDGAGDTVVMVTLESGWERIYAHELSDKASDSGRQTESSVIVIETENGDEAIVSKQIQPIIKGVAVVCEGGNILTVRENVVSAVSTVLGIPSSRVSISAMS